MIRQLLDFVANSVYAGSMPGNGKREWKFILLVAGVGIAIFVIIAVIAS